MAVIDGSDYQNIATDYAGAWSQAQGVKDYLFEAVYEVVLLQAIIPEVDLLNEFWDNYQVNTPVYGSSANFLGAVRRLNFHVLERGGYADLDAYFAAEGITVPQGWADLSADAGYTISDTYID